MIWFNGFPFLDNKEEHTFGVPVSQVMTSDVMSLPSSGLDLRSLEALMSQNRYQGFPIIETATTKALIGYIGRTELQYAINRAKKEGFISPRAKCFFSQPDSTAVQTPSTAAPPVTFDAIESATGQQSVDFSRFIDPTPLAVHPRLPLETVMELFKKMGPRVILVDYRGRLAGLVTVKDCLKFQFKVEAHETTRDDSALDERQERLWNIMIRVADWVADKVNGLSGGRIKLGGSGRSPGILEAHTTDPRDHLSPIRASHHAILDGTEDEDNGVELQNR
jgi:chloride channel 3/4/5